MKNNKLVKKLSVILGVAVVSVGFLLPESASAKDHGRGHDGQNWEFNNNHHANNNRYGWYKKSYHQGPNWNHSRENTYYQGNRGYWQEQSGVQVFIRL